MKLRVPERFVSIDVAHTGDKRLVEERAFQPGPPGAQFAEEGIKGKSRVQRVPGNMCCLNGHQRRRVLPQSARKTIRRGHHAGDKETPEDSLVDEAEFFR